jgi:hypothetical protein
VTVPRKQPAGVSLDVREGAAYMRRMLYFDCRGKRYYAGQDDLESPPRNFSSKAVAIFLAFAA